MSSRPVAARDADRAHRRFGSRVREPDLFEVEAPAQLLGEQHGVFGGHREVRAAADRALDRLDDLRVRVADDHRSEAAVRVDVLVAVDVPDVRAASFAEIDRVRIADLERRADAERHRLGALEQRVRDRRRVDEPAVLELGDLAGAHAEGIGAAGGHSFTITCLISV